MYSTSLAPLTGQFGDFSAKFLNSDAAGAAVWIWNVKNYLATPIYVTVEISQNVNAYISRDFVARSGLTSFRPANTVCGSAPCAIATPTTLYTGSAPQQLHQNVRLRARLFVMNGSETGAEISTCSGCTNDDVAQKYTFEIPPRSTAQGGPLTAYAILTYLRPGLPTGAGMDVLMAPRDAARPDGDPAPYREVTLEGVTFTGKLVGNPSGEVCVDQDLDFNGWVCTLKARKQEYRALTRIRYEWLLDVATTFSFSAMPMLPTMRSKSGTLIRTDNTWSTSEIGELP